MASVVINGHEYTLRALTVREFRKITTFEDMTDGECYAIALSTGLDVATVTAWIDSVPAAMAYKAIAAMQEASLVTEAAQFPDATPDDAVPA